MSAPLERFLARLYTDARLRERFLLDPVKATAGLDADTASALRRIDRDGLQMAAASYERKRQCRKS